MNGDEASAAGNQLPDNPFEHPSPLRSAAAETRRWASGGRVGSTFVCNMAALSAEQRARHHVLAQHLRSATIEVKELSDGYAARLVAEPATVLLVAEFLTLERLCCPFFTLGLEMKEDGGSLWLKVLGREGIKPFIRAEFDIPA